MLHVVAMITTKPGQREAVLAAFQANVPAVRAEVGCLQYEPAVDVGDGFNDLARIGPDSFMVLEKWESRAALEAHAASTHMAAYAARVKDLVVSRSVYVLDPV